MSPNIIRVNAPAAAKYLSDIPGFELPKGILAKGGTGVGGSTLAINSPYPYIIAVPTTSLIENKKVYHTNIYGVYHREGIDWDGIMLDSYLGSIPVPVFMVTYDSLGRLVKELTERGVNVYKHYRLLVDEYTEVLKAYGYRKKAIDSLLMEARKFEHTTYMSATPIPKKFTPEEFQHIPYTEVVWPQTARVKPLRIPSNKPFASVGNLVRLFRACNYSISIPGNNAVANELFIYVNSVTGIKKILDWSDAKPSEVKIICANNTRNQDILKEYAIDIPVGPNKPINFFTSKAFSGCDLFSENGLTLVVSNVHQKHTLIDIATDVFQIIGRIRNDNNPFRNAVYHVYNTGAMDLTKAEFESRVKEKVARTHGQVKAFREMDEEGKAACKKKLGADSEDDYTFYNEETGLLEFNDRKRMHEAFEFHITHEIYHSGASVRKTYNEAGFDTSGKAHFVLLAKQFKAKVLTRSFKQTAKEYVALRLSDPGASRLAELVALEPEIMEMYDRLGADFLRRVQYSKSQLRNALVAESEATKLLVGHGIYTYFKAGGFYPSAEIISVFNEVNGKNGITKPAKSSEIKRYFSAEKHQKRALGKPVKGYLLEGLRTSQTGAGGPTMG